MQLRLHRGEAKTEIEGHVAMIGQLQVQSQSVIGERDAANLNAARLQAELDAARAEIDRLRAAALQPSSPTLAVAGVPESAARAAAASPPPSL